MNLESLFGERACLADSRAREQTWRIIDVDYPTLNRMRIWLERDLETVAFNWIVSEENSSGMPDEIWSTRIGLIPISFDGELAPFELDSPTLCTEETCIVFRLQLFNTTQSTMNVLSSDLTWLPLPGQVARFATPPTITVPDLLIGKLPPGRAISLRAYAVRGTGEQHTRWSSTFAFYRAVPTKRQRVSELSIVSLPPTVMNSDCVRCEDLELDVPCFYFTTRLTGGLTFEQIGRQLEERYSIEEVEPARYKFEQ